MDECYFYKYYSKNYNYKTIIFGLESSLYQDTKPYNDRIKNKILNSGAIGKETIRSRVANKIINPKRSSWYFYKLRTLCNKLKYVEHARDVEKNYNQKDYQYILSQYCAAIGATTFYPTIKYWEISASGCLAFLEITDENHGEYLGYEDNETAIFINEKNYKKKFEEYLNDLENPKWKKIAQNGQNHTMKNLNNDRAVYSLVDLFNELPNALVEITRTGLRSQDILLIAGSNTIDPEGDEIKFEFWSDIDGLLNSGITPSDSLEWSGMLS